MICMNNKIVLFLVAVLLLGGLFAMSKNQNKAPANQEEALKESGDEGVNEEKMEDGAEEAVEEDVQEADEMEEEVSVSVTNSGFDSKSVKVGVGEKVVWLNETQATANVSSAPHPTHEDYPPLNLGNFEPGESVELVFNEVGTYKYHDHLNPSRFGTVVVE